MVANNHSAAYGYQRDIDPSEWKQDVSDGPAPAPMVQTEEGMKRVATPDPYNGQARNFGRSTND